MPRQFTGTQVDFTSGSLINHIGTYSGPGTGGANTIVQANLLEGTYYNYEGKTGKTRNGAYGGELYVRYTIKWSSNFDFARGMKIFRVTAADAQSQTNWFDYVVVMQDANGAADSAAMTNNSQLLAQRNSGSNWGSFSFNPTRNVDYDLKFRLKIESSDGAGNGVFQMWANRSDEPETLKLTYNGNLGHSATGYYANMESLLFGGWYSNGTQNPNPTSGISWQMKDAYFSSTNITEILSNGNSSHRAHRFGSCPSIGLGY